MRPVLLILSVIGVTFGFSTDWEMWKREHGKDYTYENEEMLRYAIFQSNKMYVDTHNQHADKYGFDLELNEFADLDGAEFAAIHNGYLSHLKKDVTNSTRVFQKSPSSNCPDTVDWTTQGYVTPVKNQGQCGSCWSFSTTGSLEGQHFKKTGKLVSLSEQQLVDCSTSEGNHGCQGGLMDYAFKYIESNGGDDTEASYPYKAENGKCHFNKADVGATCTGYVDVATQDCDALKQAICTIGPISVAMDASHLSFQFYKSGVYNPLICSSTKLDHGVLAVGYGVENGKDYFLIKNSWGAAWGDKGYFKIINHNNKCGICTQASYPTV